MRILIQRVSSARVEVDQKIVGEIDSGLLLFLGIHRDDTPEQADWLANKVIGLRCFTDEGGKMNLSTSDVGGNLLVVSQFTLYASCQNGRRPDFGATASPELAKPLYDRFVEQLRTPFSRVQMGVFGAKMDVHLVNDGPVTFLIEK